MPLLSLPFHWIRKAAVHRAFWLGGPLLLYAWTVTGPFLCDDHILILKAERFHRSESRHLDLFRFAKSDDAWQALRNRGTYPWWASEIGRFDFFRPLAEWSFYLDYRLFGRNPLGHRLVGLLVFSLALLCVHWLFMQAGQDLIRAGVATFFFGISQTAALPVTWISNRADLLALIGISLASGAYWSSRHRPKARLAIYAVGGFILALLAKEVAVPLALVVASHEIYLRRRDSARREKPLARLIAVLLVLVLGLYAAYYLQARPAAFGMTQQQVGPLLMLWRLPRSLLLNLAVWTTGFPISALLEATEFQINAVAAAGAIATLILAPFLRKSMRGDRAAPFFILWALLFMLPGLGAFTSTRLLCVATVGWAYLLAGLIIPSHEDDLVVPAPLRHWFYAANGVVSVGCVIGTVLFMNHSELSCRRRMREALSNLDPPLRSGETLVMGDAKSTMEIIGCADRLEYLTGLKDLNVVYLVAPKTQIADIRREGDHALLLRSDGSSLFGTPLHRFTLGPAWQPYSAGVFQLEDFTAEIVEVRGVNEVAALRFRFHQPLSSPSLHFYPPTLEAVAQGHRTPLAHADSDS